MLFLARLCFVCRISMVFLFQLLEQRDYVFPSASFFSSDHGFVINAINQQALFHIVLNSAASINIWKSLFTHTDSTNFVLDVEDGLLQVFYLFVLVFHPLLMFKSCPP